MQNKATTKYHYTPTTMAKIKRLITANADKDVEQPESSHMAGKNGKTIGSFL